MFFLNTRSITFDLNIKNFMKLIDKFEKFLDKSAAQVGGYKILVVVALVLGYFLGSIFS